MFRLVNAAVLLLPAHRSIVAVREPFLSMMEPGRLIMANPTSLLLAPIVGGYLCVSGIGLLRKGEAGSFLANLCAHPAAMHAVGGVAFFAGAAVLSLHRHWGTPSEIAINLVALIWLVEGGGILADPARLRMALATPKAAFRLRYVQLFNIPLGLYLLAVGILGISG
ncbi:hypothetical protein [Brevundimonas sp.]|uniref:hypothetical protein n=1 Tax=Brevundimonas sp. TaxID=1871086 RepID=UPI0037BF4B53